MLTIAPYACPPPGTRNPQLVRTIDSRSLPAAGNTISLYLFMFAVLQNGLNLCIMPLLGPSSYPLPGFGLLESNGFNLPPFKVSFYF